MENPAPKPAQPNATARSTSLSPFPSRPSPACSLFSHRPRLPRAPWPSPCARPLPLRSARERVACVPLTCRPHTPDSPSTSRNGCARHAEIPGEPSFPSPRRDPRPALFKPPRGPPCSHPQQPRQNPSRSALPLLGADSFALPRASPATAFRLLPTTPGASPEHQDPPRILHARPRSAPRRNRAGPQHR